MTDYLVRHAVENDLDECLDMGARFHAGTAYAAYVPYCRATVLAHAKMCMDAGVLLVAERAGALIGVVGLIGAPSIFNNAVACAYEAIWWVNPEEQETGAGRALFLAVEPACKAKGFKAIHMLHLSNSPPQAAAMYQRSGYEYSEAVYIKVI
jgi:GNAT superfamily N-acetyltransferase